MTRSGLPDRLRGQGGVELVVDQELRVVEVQAREDLVLRGVVVRDASVENVSIWRSPAAAGSGRGREAASGVWKRDALLLLVDRAGRGRPRPRGSCPVELAREHLDERGLADADRSVDRQVAELDVARTGIGIAGASRCAAGSSSGSAVEHAPIAPRSMRGRAVSPIGPVARVQLVVASRHAPSASSSVVRARDSVSPSAKWWSARRQASSTCRSARSVAAAGSAGEEKSWVVRTCGSPLSCRSRSGKPRAELNGLSRRFPRGSAVRELAREHRFPDERGRTVADRSVDREVPELDVAFGGNRHRRGFERERAAASASEAAKRASTRPSLERGSVSRSGPRPRGPVARGCDLSASRNADSWPHRLVLAGHHRHGFRVQMAAGPPSVEQAERARGEVIANRLELLMPPRRTSVSLLGVVPCGRGRRAARVSARDQTQPLDARPVGSVARGVVVQRTPSQSAQGKTPVNVTGDENDRPAWPASARLLDEDLEFRRGAAGDHRIGRLRRKERLVAGQEIRRAHDVAAAGDDVRAR